MHKTMTRPTQPRHTPQHPLRMPSPLHHLRVHRARYQMVIRQRDPVTLTDLARVCPRRRPYWRASGHGFHVVVEERQEEGFGDVLGVCEEGVGG